MERLVKGKGEPNSLTAVEKLELWNRLKILNFTRMVLSLWATTILILYIRVQVNILGRHLYIDTARGLEISIQLDIEANNQKVNVYTDNNTFQETLRVGDLIKVFKDEYFSADLLLLSSSYEDGICYVETFNLDGVTNLKVKHALNITSSLNDDSSFQNCKAVVKCEDPNENLYTFIGTLYYDKQQNPLLVQQILLRGLKLRNTDYVYGVIIFTGHDTKVTQNSTDPPSKKSGIEKRMDRIIYVLFGTVITIAFIGSIFFGIETKNDISGGKLRRWYLRPDKTSVFYDPKRASLAAFFHFRTTLCYMGT
ncbi:hypothetical protein P3L10_002110 [Capsicum annuum]